MSVVMSTNKFLDEILNSLNKRFNEMEENLDKRFNEMEIKMETKIETKLKLFDNIEENLDKRFNEIEDKLEDKLEDIEENLTKEIKRLKSQIHGIKMDYKTDREISRLSKLYSQNSDNSIHISPGGNQEYSALCRDEETRDQPSFI